MSVVILNWNGRETTSACLRSVRSMNYPNLSVIVVDNASTDGSAGELSRETGISLICNEQNLGFTGGVNVGIRRALETGATYVWLLNSDATAGPDVLNKLVTVAESNPRIGLVSPVFHDPEPPRAPNMLLARFEPRARVASQTNDPDVARRWLDECPDEVVLLGTALLVRRALIERIGGLDSRFFAYVEDVDYSLRSVGAGFRNVVVPDAVVYHGFKRPVEDPDSVPPYLHYFMSRNYPLLWRKLPGRVLLSKSMLWFLRERMLALTRVHHNPSAVNALLAGLWDGWRGTGGPYDPTRQMPALLHSLFARHAGAWLALLDGRLPWRA